MLQVGALSVATFIAIFLLADRLPDSWLHVIGRAGPGVAKAVAGVLAVVVFMAAVAATCSALTGVSLAQYGRVVVGADCATLPAIMGSAGSLQPETSDAWGAGALKYRWQGRSLLANAEVTCLQGRVSTKTQDGLRSTTELTVWGTVLGLFGLAGLLLWAALKGRTQRIPARRRAHNAAAMLASWLVAFAVAPGVMSTFQLPASAQVSVVFGIAMSAKVIYFLARGGSKSEPRGIEIDTPEREV